jgi:hypothetical protein
MEEKTRQKQVKSAKNRPKWVVSAILKRFSALKSTKRDQKTQFHIILHPFFSHSGQKMGTPHPFTKNFPKIPTLPHPPNPNNLPPLALHRELCLCLAWGLASHYTQRNFCLWPVSEADAKGLGTANLICLITSLDYFSTCE